MASSAYTNEASAASGSPTRSGDDGGDRKEGVGRAERRVRSLRGGSGEECTPSASALSPSRLPPPALSPLLNAPCPESRRAWEPLESPSLEAPNSGADAGGIATEGVVWGLGGWRNPLWPADAASRAGRDE